MSAPPVAASRGAADDPAPPRASVALSRRNASMLAYAAGWLSGLLLLLLESRDREVRWHAAQAFLGFGVLSVLAVTLLAAAGASLFVSIALFRVCLWLAQSVIVVGAVLWLVSLVQVARGRAFRWPLLAGRAERLAGRPLAPFDI